MLRSDELPLLQWGTVISAVSAVTGHTMTRYLLG